MRAVIFPGQGSQFVGMGLDFYEQHDSVKKIFKRVDETLGFSLSNIILKGPESDLKLTKNTQPAIMVVGVSIFQVLKEHYNLDLSKSKFFAGHSLGEYTALVCSNSLTIEKAAYLLHERGKAMQEAVPVGKGAMLAILGSKIEEINELISQFNQKGVCEIANDNSDGQTIISGNKESITDLHNVLKEKKRKLFCFQSARLFIVL